MVGVTGLYNSYGSSALSAHNAKAREVGAELNKLATGRNLDNPAVNSIVNKLNSDLGVFRQNQISAQNGQSLLQVASGALNSQINILSQMRVLSAQSANGDITDTTRAASLDNDYQTLLKQLDLTATQARWNDGSLLTGGAVATPTFAGPITATGSVVADGANIIAAGIVAANSTGFISGQATGVTVNANAANAANFDISIQIKDAAGGVQTFQAQNVSLANSAPLTLMSQSDSNNAITLTLGSAAAGVSQTALSAALTKSLGLGAGEAPASFSSSSVAQPATVGSIAASSSTPAGTYALSYAANSNTLVLSQGASEFRVPLTASGAQNVTFANGMSVSLAAGFALNAPVAQTVFTVAGSSSESFTFQLNTLSSDTETVSIAAASSAALGLNGSNIKSQSSAQQATTNLIAAIQNVNNSLTQIDAAQKSLQATSDNLDVTILNTRNAIQTYGDVDLPETLANYSQAKVMVDVSYTAISQSLTLEKDLAQFIKQNA